eukprot:9356537-Pyramimonas_sp.AAC.1
MRSASAQNLAAGMSSATLNKTGAAGSPCRSDLDRRTQSETMSSLRAKMEPDLRISRNQAADKIRGAPLASRPASKVECFV